MWWNTLTTTMWLLRTMHVLGFMMLFLLKTTIHSSYYLLVYRFEFSLCWQLFRQLTTSCCIHYMAKMILWTTLSCLLVLLCVVTVDPTDRVIIVFFVFCGWNILVFRSIFQYALDLAAWIAIALPGLLTISCYVVRKKLIFVIASTNKVMLAFSSTACNHSFCRICH